MDLKCVDREMVCVAEGANAADDGDLCSGAAAPIGPSRGVPGTARGVGATSTLGCDPKSPLSGGPRGDEALSTMPRDVVLVRTSGAERTPAPPCTSRNDVDTTAASKVTSGAPACITRSVGGALGRPPSSPLSSPGSSKSELTKRSGRVPRSPCSSWAKASAASANAARFVVPNAPLDAPPPPVASACSLSFAFASWYSCSNAPAIVACATVASTTRRSTGVLTAYCHGIMP
mmetsp:Transcript_28828/g.89255  ORF Transcript_28828/g.89255 Transcript_28828/m.89255 type:complete len:232 (-) Transcript_28828:148-843(-)